MGVCKLCDKESNLERSHIIPRSLLKDVKDGDSQLHVFAKDSPPKYENVDPKEKLLCHDCEQYLSSAYEQYGTRLLKNHKNVIKSKDYIEFKEFDYQKWYFFFLSILWRASVSSIKEFQHLDLGGLSQVLKHCIRNNTLSLSDTISIDECIIINMYRVVDRSQRMDDKAIKNIMLSLTAVKEGEDTIFFFMVNGFLIQYRCTPYLMKVKKQMSLNKSDESRHSHRKVKFVDIADSKFLCENFNWLVESV